MLQMAAHELLLFYYCVKRIAPVCKACSLLVVATPFAHSQGKQSVPHLMIL